jgi:hypothetical protein
MRDVALLGINPGMSTAFLDRGRGRLACAACLGNLSASALTILRRISKTKKNNQNKNNVMHGRKASSSSYYVPPVSKAMRHEHAQANKASVDKRPPRMGKSSKIRAPVFHIATPAGKG